MKQFENILNQIKDFSKSQKRSLGKYILSLCKAKDLFETRGEIIDGCPTCPHCESEKVKKNGSHRGKQRYVCQDCGKGFRDMTGTFAYRMKQVEKLPRFIELMLQSCSVREISKELQMGRQTVLDWRHKILSAFNDTFTKDFMGIVEVDDVYVRFNQKGRRDKFFTFLEGHRRTFVWTNDYGERISRRMDNKMKTGISDEQVSVLFCIDRYGTIGAKKLRKNKVNTKSIKRLYDNGFGERFNYGNIVVTDGNTAYRRVFKNEVFTHEEVVIDTENKRFKNGFLHLNTLNNVDGRFKKWLKGNFSSVATKYLDNYLMYFKMLFFVLKDMDDKESELLRFALADDKAYTRMKRIEEDYQKFLEW